MQKTLIKGKITSYLAYSAEEKIKVFIGVNDYDMKKAQKSPKLQYTAKRVRWDEYDILHNARIKYGRGAWGATI